ncbi:MAG: TatD family hydrolase [Candidatus Delongbacteria bacterium]|nr:TatD family hydrolase [Candidatus Delongbacteria bacterium]
MFFESHAHLYFEHYDEDRDKLINELLSTEIDGIINVGVDIETSYQSIRLAEKYDRIYAAVGLHPTDLKSNSDDAVKEIRELLKHDKVVALGETGLDLYWDKVPFETQRKYFIKQLELSLEENFPVIIHSRDAEIETMKVINEVSDNYTGVFHCYAGSADTALELIDKGFYISFTGNITYKKNDREEVIKALPLDRLLLETDSPFLTPVPFRGKRNDPSKLRYIAQKIADLKNISIEEVSKVTLENTRKLFKIFDN